MAAQSFHCRLGVENVVKPNQNAMLTLSILKGLQAREESLVVHGCAPALWRSDLAEAWHPCTCLL